jgi:hypothetical protein
VSCREPDEPAVHHEVAEDALLVGRRVCSAPLALRPPSCSGAQRLDRHVQSILLCDESRSNKTRQCGLDVGPLETAVLRDLVDRPRAERDRAEDPETVLVREQADEGRGISHRGEA